MKRTDCEIKLNMSVKKKKQLMQGKSCFSRMNFLYQAAVLYAGKNDTLSAYYGKLCTSIAKKATLKIDPNIKRELCKRCSVVLKPGITADLDCTTIATTKSQRRRRQRKPASNNSNENAAIHMKCRKCGYDRSFNVNDNYSFWLDNPKSIAEIITLKDDANQSQNAQSIDNKIQTVCQPNKPNSQNK